MPAVWLALKCRSERREVHDPESGGKNISISSKKRSCGRSGCSRSIANLKDVVINGSNRHADKATICSPRSIGSSELLNPITHEVVLDNSTCELKIRGGGGGGGFHVGRGRILGSPVRRSFTSSSSSRPRSPLVSHGHAGAPLCPKCGEQFVRWEAVEAHHLSKHVVSEVGEGDSSRRIVEMICGAGSSWRGDGGIHRILKVHNMQRTVAQFEEYREIVKIKASKLAKKHPRCLADGNELLRFHGATLDCDCTLGMNGSSTTLCTSDQCRVCLILRHGFSTAAAGGGVFTASTSTRAFHSIQSNYPNPRKALILCRVIAGRVHRPLHNLQQMVAQSGFDSLAGKLGVHSNIEELYLLSPTALLPCFVVIYKP
ncbi:zinc finger family protein [Perilla frutescens var. hirtella]|nr:zinc finger family protein [Perilla frutescens var. hirtella]